MWANIGVAWVALVGGFVLQRKFAQRVRAGARRAIVDRFVEAHPERWDEDMSTVAYGALTQACTARGFAPKTD